MKERRKDFDRGQIVREIARERVGPVKAGKVIMPKKRKNRRGKEWEKEDERDDE